MKKRILIGQVIMLVALLSPLTYSQSEPDNETGDLKKFEIGGQFTFLRRSDANTAFDTFQQNGFINSDVEPANLSERGIGGRFGYNINKNIAAEAEINFFPIDKKADPQLGVPLRITEPGGRKLQVLFGPKIGFRARRYGIFGKIRPGIIRFDRYPVVTQVGPPSNFFVLTERRRGVTFFNLDLGGVFEYYPSKRTLVRFDIGDTIIRYNAQEPKDINPTFTRHNLQMNVGFGFRF